MSNARETLRCVERQRERVPEENDKWTLKWKIPLWPRVEAESEETYFQHSSFFVFNQNDKDHVVEHTLPFFFFSLPSLMSLTFPVSVNFTVLI